MVLANIKNADYPITIPLFLATIVIGVGAGLSGMLLVYLLHFTQHIAYGYSLHAIISSERFLSGVTAASPQRRIIVLTLCGLIAGIGWWAIYRFGKPIVGIPDAVKTDPSRMPRLTTILHALLQMITVAMGSPLGREVAPREIGAVFASWFSSKMGLTLRDAKVMAACGAGAGLAAVYNVPLGGAMFTLEVLLCNFNGSAVLLAIISSTIAVVISRLGLGDVSQFEIPMLTINSSLVLWSVVTAPIFGITAYWFNRGGAYMGSLVQHNWQVPLFCLLNFFMIGLLAIYFPELLGNGISVAQLEFTNAVGIGLSAILLIFRIFITLTSLRAGAHGGLLTPSVANGALLAVVLGCIWRLLGSDTDLSAFAIVGAAAFLAVAQEMPLTAIILIFEFTHVEFSFMLPVLCAVIGAVSVSRWYMRIEKNRT